MSSAIPAENPPVHWYRIIITEGNTASTFIGSSSLNSDQLTAKIQDNQFISLENQRDVVASPGETEVRMQPVYEGEKLFIAARTVLYFSELPKDPAVPKK